MGEQQNYSDDSSALIICLGLFSIFAFSTLQYFTVRNYFYLHLGWGTNFFVSLVPLVSASIPTMIAALVAMMALRGRDFKDTVRWCLSFICLKPLKDVYLKDIAYWCLVFICLGWVTLGMVLVVISSVEVWRGMLGQAFLLCGWSFAFFIVLIREFIQFIRESVSGRKLKTCQVHGTVIHQTQGEAADSWIKDNIVIVEGLIIGLSLICILYLGWVDSQGLSGRVSKVISGDTLIFEGTGGTKTKIHLFGVYAENNQSATAALTKMVVGQKVTVKLKRVRYRRGRVGIVKIDNQDVYQTRPKPGLITNVYQTRPKSDLVTDVGLAMIRTGLAYVRHSDFVVSYSRAGKRTIGEEVRDEYLRAGIMSEYTQKKGTDYTDDH